MSKCPFWSTTRERINCHSDCPMYPTSKNDELCPFVEYLTGSKITYKDIEDDFAYSQQNLYDLSLVGYKKY